MSKQSSNVFPSISPGNLSFFRSPRVVLGFGMAALFYILLANLWVSDDAFISLRVANNFIHGYGLVWNVGERVQVFTHPLWLFGLIVFKFFSPDPLYAFYIPSIILSVATVYLILARFARSVRSIVLATIVLGGSMAFVDFSSSGLENPLTHFLIALLLIALYRDDPSPLRKLAKISLLAGLASLNRMDTVLIFAPALIYQLRLCRTKFGRATVIIALGFLPFILWETFALFYYGFPFPNTFYVKVQTGLPVRQLFSQGWGYFENSFRVDPITLGAVFLGIISVGLRREPRRAALALGAVLYGLYVLWIGGDFMSGRYFSGIFLIGIVLLLTFDFNRYFDPVPKNLYGPVVLVVLLIGLSAERPPIFMHDGRPGAPVDQYGIVLEKYYYFQHTGYFSHLRHPLDQTRNAIEGKEIRRQSLKSYETNMIGLCGYYAGPNVYIIDSFALADPLRARLPVMGPTRIGHYDREYPEGYRETIQGGFKENRIESPSLRLYYDKLSILVRGDLRAPGRLWEIFKFNIGYYDYLIEEYLAEAGG